MSFWDADNVRAAVAGIWRARPNRALEGVSIDSRTIEPGEVFVCLRGDNFDGHDFARAAAAAGASMVVVDDPGFEPSDLGDGIGVLRVGDTLKALVQLAAAYRRALDGTRVVAVTGSNGKTTTVRLIRSVLETKLRGTSSTKSYNNIIGVPLTLLSARPGDQFLVSEVGMNAPGEIAPLARILEPDVAVITNIGRAHIEAFDDINGIAREKATLLSFLRPNGLAVAPADTDLLDDYVKPVPSLITVGERDGADLRITSLEQIPGEGIRFSVNDRADYRLPMLGRHNACNALSAIAVGRRFGLSDEEITAGLQNAQTPEMRFERRDFGGIEVFNDAYNASPESVAAAVTTFADVSSGARRRVLILGDMLELGEHGPDAHLEIAALIGETIEPDLLVTVGPLALLIAERLSREWAPGRVMIHSELDDDSAERITSRLQPGDAVLVKGSRRIGLERIVRTLERRATASSGTGT
ncbi:MAG: UDP-N-acetylmuramoyl-tripeptide--D-alanyl-D-alanine ligase [Planctomycetota bacterium]